MKTLLVSPEQIQDACVPWMREATTDEWDRFKDEHPALLQVDQNCRPYFPMVIDETHPDFPPHLTAQVNRALRIFRFWEKPQ